MGEGAYEGSRCLACLEEAWAEATIRRVLGDGTLRIEFDRKSSVLMPYWFGVPLEQVSFDVSDDAQDQQRVAPAYAKLYWNQTRMGGRDPGEIARVLSVDDSLSAMGLAPNDLDPERASAWHAVFARHGVRIPEGIVAMLSARGFAPAVGAIHPNNPRPLSPAEASRWLFLDGRARGLSGDVALPLLEQEQYVWAAVFEPCSAEAAVYLFEVDDDGIDAASGRLAAPSAEFFFWDLTQTGLAWWRERRPEAGKPIEVTDIGLALRP